MHYSDAEIRGEKRRVVLENEGRNWGNDKVKLNEQPPTHHHPLSRDRANLIMVNGERQFANRIVCAAEKCR